ncbi:MAG: MBL fold metallo-hydrolase [Armatimonadota bacterium]|nr:MBL fold metallo-hydrolase [Armatimonadota bacterium]
MKLEITILGSGTSHGVPMIACDCPVCSSSDPRNNRTRASVLIRGSEHWLLIDTTPELRVQFIREKVRRVDAIAFTHAHADHIFGLDDIRGINEICDCEIPCYGHKRTIEAIRGSFPYIFRATQVGGGKPRLSLNLIEGPFEAAGMTVTPIPVWHGRVRAMGYRIGDFAYVTDTSRIPPESAELLMGLDTLVLGVPRHAPHPTHFNLEQGLDQISALRPRRAILTHLSHAFEHEATNAVLPEGVELAWDGMVLQIE